MSISQKWRVFLIVLALVICTGTAYGQVLQVSGGPINLIYVNNDPTARTWMSGGATVTETSGSAGDNYQVDATTLVPCPWLNMATGANAAQISTLADTVTASVIPGSSLSPGLHTCNNVGLILNLGAGGTGAGATVTVNVTVYDSLLTPSSSSQVNLLYVTTATGAQSYNSNNGVTVSVPAGVSGMGWTQTVSAPLSGKVTVSATGGANISAGVNSTLTISSTYAIPGTYNGNVTLQSPNQTDVTIPVQLVVQAMPINYAGGSVNLTYVIGMGTVAGPQAGWASKSNVQITAPQPVSALAWTVDAATLPGFVTALAGAPITGGAPQNLTVTAAPSASPTAGIQNGSVHLTVAGYSGFINVPVQLTILNTPLVASTQLLNLTYDTTPGTQANVQNAAHGTINIDLPVGSGLTNITFAQDQAGQTANVALTGSAPPWTIASPGSGVQVTVTIVPGSLAAGTYKTALYFKVTAPAQAPVVDLQVPVTVNIVSTDLMSNPSTVLFNYNKATPATPVSPVSQLINFTSSIGGPVAVSKVTSSIPLWLTVTTTATSATITPVAAVLPALATGNYTAKVQFQNGAQASYLTVPVTLSISNGAPTVSIKEASGVTGNINLPATIGMVSPQVPFTIMSSGDAISFTAQCTMTTTNTSYAGAQGAGQGCTMTSGGAATTGGVAYSWGYPIVVTPTSGVFNGAVFGNTVTVSLTASYTSNGAPATATLTYVYTVTPANPNLSTISPTAVAPLAPGQSVVVLLTGANFISAANLAAGSNLAPTQIFLGSSNLNVTNNPGQVTVLDSTHIALRIDANELPVLSGANTTVLLSIGAANGLTANATPITPYMSINLKVTLNPVIYSITSSASYAQPVGTANPTVAPYDMVSIFGANFGPPTSGSNATIVAYPDNWGKYPSKSGLVVSGSNSLMVTFTTPTVGVVKGVTYYAPVLFATANQINVLVPSGIAPVAAPGTTVNVQVSFGNLASTVAGLVANSDNFQVGIVPSDPAVLTLASDGTGQAAVIDATNSNLVNDASGGKRIKAGDTIQIYLAGMGIPDSTTVNQSTVAASGYPAGCIAISTGKTATPGYMENINTPITGASPYAAPNPAWTTIDGAVILTNHIPQPNGGTHFAPCFLAADAVTVTFGNDVNAVTVWNDPASPTITPIGYAGFVGGSVAGLYQVNVVVPQNVEISDTLPLSVSITKGGVVYNTSTSQNGITIATDLIN